MTLGAVVGWEVAIPLGAAAVTAAIYYARTTPAQRAAARRRTDRIEGAREWQRGPTLMAVAVAILIPALFLTRLAMFVLLPISVLLIVAGLVWMEVARQRYG